LDSIDIVGLAPRANASSFSVSYYILVFLITYLIILNLSREFRPLRRVTLLQQPKRVTRAPLFYIHVTTALVHPEHRRSPPRLRPCIKNAGVPI